MAFLKNIFFDRDQKFSFANAYPEPSGPLSYIKLVVLFFGTFISGLTFASLFLATSYSIPVLTKQILEFLLEEHTLVRDPEVMSLLMWLIVITFSSWVFLNHTFHKAYELGLKARAYLARLLVRPERFHAGAGESELVSLFSHDLPKVEGGVEALVLVLLIVASIVIACGLLVSFLGPASLCGVAVLIVMQAIAQRQNKKMKLASAAVSQESAKRVSLARFLVTNVVSIRMQNWTTIMSVKIDSAREGERKAIENSNGIVVLINLIFLSTPVLVTFASLIPAFLFSNNFSGSTVFPAFILFGTIRSAFANLPQVVVSLIQGGSSLRLISNHLSQPCVLRRKFPINKELMRRVNGKKIAIVGPSGSGKSTFLTELAESFAETHAVAFVEQAPWIFAGSLEDNITVTGLKNAAGLASVLEATDLAVDLRVMKKNGGMDLQSEGRNLSGGQKLRVAIARAAYSKASHVFLDDPLGALDSKVRKKIVDLCFNGIWKNSTLVISTSNLADAGPVDLVIEIDHEHKFKMKSVEELSGAYVPDSVPFDAASRLDPVAESEIEDRVDGVKVEEIDFMRSLRGFLRIFGTKKLIAFVGFLFLIREAFIIGADLNISRAALESGWPVSRIVDFALGQFCLVFAAISVSAILIFLLLRKTLKAAGLLHSKFVNFFISNNNYFNESQSQSEHLGRLYHDQRIVDLSLGQKFIDYLTALFALIGGLLLIGSQMPYIILGAAPLAFVYWRLQKIYRKAAVGLARKESDSNGLLMQHLVDYIRGQRQLQYMRKQGDFARIHFLPKLENFESILCASNLFVRWFSLRIEFIGAAVFSAVLIVSYIRWHSGTVLDGSSGIALAYASMMTAVLGRVIRSMAEFERDLVSCDNISQYFAKDDESKTKNKYEGLADLKVEDLSFRYDLCSEPSLKNLSFCLMEGEKIAVIGRTGSGKSTLINALMGARSNVTGEIFLGDLDISKIPTQCIVEHICLVPQQPDIIPGTIREILGDLAHSEEDIWGALAVVELDSEIRGLPGRLDFDCADSSNLSKVQKMRLLMARALLSDAKIILLDEPTANLGEEIGSILIEKIMEKLKSKTVIVVTHQSNLLSQFDKVLELSEGVGQLRSHRI